MCNLDHFHYLVFDIKMHVALNTQMYILKLIMVLIREQYEINLHVQFEARAFFACLKVVSQCNCIFVGHFDVQFRKP